MSSRRPKLRCERKSRPFDMLPTSTRRTWPRSKSSVTLGVRLSKPKARADMLPKPLGTGTKGIESRTEAPAAALRVASPPTATRCEKSGSQESDHSSSLPRLPNDCTRTVQPRRLRALRTRRVMNRARPSPDPGVTTICTTVRIRQIAAVMPGETPRNLRSEGEMGSRDRLTSGHHFRVRRIDRGRSGDATYPSGPIAAALYSGAMLDPLDELELDPAGARLWPVIARGSSRRVCCPPRWSTSWRVVAALLPCLISPAAAVP